MSNCCPLGYLFRQNRESLGCENIPFYGIQVIEKKTSMRKKWKNNEPTEIMFWELIKK